MKELYKILQNLHSHPNSFNKPFLLNHTFINLQLLHFHSFPQILTNYLLHFNFILRTQVTRLTKRVKHVKHSFSFQLVEMPTSPLEEAGR